MTGMGNLIMALIFIGLSLGNGLLFVETNIIACFVGQIACFLVAIIELVKWKRAQQ